MSSHGERISITADDYRSTADEYHRCLWLFAKEAVRGGGGTAFPNEEGLVFFVSSTVSETDSPTAVVSYILGWT